MDKALKIMQSTIERLLYVVLLLVFIASLLTSYFAYHDGQEIKQLITSSHNSNVQTQQIIITKLNTQDSDLRNSVKCLFSLNPSTGTATEAQACFTIQEAK